MADNLFCGLFLTLYCHFHFLTSKRGGVFVGGDFLQLKDGVEGGNNINSADAAHVEMFVDAVVSELTKAVDLVSSL